MSLEENKALVRRYYAAISHDGDLAALDEICSPAFTHGAEDLARHKESMGGIRAGFPDVRFAIDDLIAEGETVWTRGTVRGTHLGEALGHPPTGKTIHLEECFNVFRVEGGQLVDNSPHWACQYGTLLEQIGGGPPA
jgi:predicted ester cyclase